MRGWLKALLLLILVGGGAAAGWWLLHQGIIPPLLPWLAAILIGTIGLIAAALPAKTP